jgi:hypothetical protein
MGKHRAAEKVILVTKIDRAAIDAQIAEHGVAIIEPPQDDDCELEAVQGDYLFWEAELDVEALDDDEMDEDDED